MPVPRLCNAHSTALLGVIAAAFLGLCVSNAEATCGDYLVGRHTMQLSSACPPADLPGKPCRVPYCGQSPDRPHLPLPQQRVVVPSQELAVLPLEIAELSLAAAWDWQISQAARVEFF